MNRPLLISAMMLLCLLAPLIRAEQANGKLAQVLSAKRDEIRALGSQPCAPTKDPCTYGKEIGATLSKMAQDIVSQNNLEAKEGKVLFTEWINNTKSKFADKECAQESFDSNYESFTSKYHKKNCKKGKFVPAVAKKIVELAVNPPKKILKPQTTKPSASPVKKLLPAKRKPNTQVPHTSPVVHAPTVFPVYPSCEIGSEEYISTSEIRERIKELEQALREKGMTCGKKEGLLKRILGAYEELLKEESIRISKLKKAYKETTSCSRRIRLTKLLLIAQESHSEAKQGWYDYKLKNYRSEESALKASKAVTMDQIEQIHVQLPKASDGEDVELRNSLTKEVKNLKRINKRLYKLAKKRAKLSFSMSRKEHKIESAVAILNAKISNSQDKCESKILTLKIKSFRRRYEMQEVIMKKIRVKERIFKLRRKQSELLRRLESAKTHEERQRIRIRIAKIEKKFTVIKHKYGKLVHIHELHHSTLVIRKLHSSKKTLEKRITVVKDLKKKQRLEERLKIVNVKINSTSKKINKIKKQISHSKEVIHSSKHVSSISSKHEQHSSLKHSEHASSRTKHGATSPESKSVPQSKHPYTQSKKGSPRHASFQMHDHSGNPRRRNPNKKGKIPEGLVEETNAIEMERILVSNIHTQIDLQSFIKTLTVKSTSDLVQKEYAAVILSSMHKVEPLVNKAFLIEVELKDHLMEIAINKKRIEDSWNPTRTELLQRRILELEKLKDEEVQEVADLVFRINRFQRRIQESQLRIAKLTHKVLKLVPSVKRRVYQLPEIKPIGSGSAHSSAIPRPEVYFEEVAPKMKETLEEAKGIQASAQAQEIKDFVGTRISTLEAITTEVDNLGKQILQTRTDIENLEKQIDSEITTYVHEQDDAKRAKLEQHVDELKHTLQEKFKNVHVLISTMNDRQSKAVVITEEIAYKSAGKIHLPPLVKEERSPYRKLVRLQRTLVSRLRKEEKLVQEIFSHKMPVTAKNCKCCADYMARTQHHMKLLHQEIDMLRKRNLHKGRIHDPNELVRQLRQKIEWLKQKNTQLQIDYKNYVAHEPDRVKIIREPPVIVAQNKPQQLPALGGADSRIIEVHIKDEEQIKNGTVPVVIPKRPIPKKVVPSRLPGDRLYPLITEGHKKYIRKQFDNKPGQVAETQQTSTEVQFQRREQLTGTYGWQDKMSLTDKRKSRRFIKNEQNSSKDQNPQGKNWHSSLEVADEIGHHGKKGKVSGKFTRTNEKVTIKFFHKKVETKKIRVKKVRDAKRFVSKRDYIDSDRGEKTVQINDSRKQPQPLVPSKAFTNQRKALSLAQSDSSELDDSPESGLLMV